jgi:hypothetical protein
VKAAPEENVNLTLKNKLAKFHRAGRDDPTRATRLIPFLHNILTESVAFISKGCIREKRVIKYKNVDPIGEKSIPK